MVLVGGVLTGYVPLSPTKIDFSSDLEKDNKKKKVCNKEGVSVSGAEDWMGTMRGLWRREGERIGKRERVGKREEGRDKGEGMQGEGEGREKG